MTVAAIQTRRFIQTIPGSIVLAGLAAGVLDAVYFSANAWIAGRSPVGVLHVIASFWVGGRSSLNGSEMAGLGLVTHFGLAVVMAAGFAVLRLRMRLLRGSTLLAGTIYGLSLYAVMYLIVLPLRWPNLYPRFDGWRSGLDVLVHIAVGICIAVVLRRKGAK